MPTKKILTNIILLIISSRLLFLTAAFLAPLFIPLRQGYLGSILNPQDPSFVWVWANFDGYHYLSIATEGYQKLLQVQKYEFAFFPLYPVSIATLHFLTKIPHLYSGLAISLISFLLAVLMIYKITIIDFNKKVALLSISLLVFFPLSFYYHSVYTDSLFLVLTTSSFYFARQGNWRAAGLFGALSTFDRLSGLSIIPALALEWYLQNKKLFKHKQKFFFSFLKGGAITLFFTCLGFLTYAYYLQVNFGNWLLFHKSMKAWNQDSFVFPPQVILRYLKIFFSVSPTLYEYWIAVLELTSFLFYMYLTFYIWKKIRVSYGVFMFILLLLVPFTGTLWGGPRYILHLFPAFIGLAILISKNKSLRTIIILLFLLLGLILSSFFTRGYFVS